MDIKAAILEEHSKRQTLRIKNYIGADAGKFAELMNLVLDDDYRLVQRASWVTKHCCDDHPDLLAPYLAQLIPQLRTPKHDAFKRNVLQIISNLEVPSEYIGELADICFDSLENRKEAIAIRVHAMANLFNICKVEPELLLELKMLIEEYMPHEMPAFKSRGKKILKAMNKLSRG